MLTWQIDRLLRAGPMCALTTFVIPAALALLVYTTTDVENVLGIVLIASGIIFIGSVVGSVVASGMGALLFALGSVLAEVAPWVLVVVGIGLYATLVMHDLAGSFRRAPRIKFDVWKQAAIITALIAAVSAATFAVTYALATLATWQAIVVPFGIAGVGFAIKLAADAHVVAARQLTAKRDIQPEDFPNA